MPSAQQDRGPDIARLPRVRVIERAELDQRAFLAAEVETARALALLRQDDLGNFHAALRAQELNSDLRLVMAIFNTGLGERIRSFFSDCAVLSGSAMAAPSFVASALGEPAPSHVRVSGRTLYVARREDVDREHLVCGLAVTAGLGHPTSLLPSDEDTADLVLAVADGTPRYPFKRPRRRPLHVAAGPLRTVFGHKLGAVFALLLAVLVAGFVLLATSGAYSWPDALYFTFLDAAGDGRDQNRAATHGEGRAVPADLRRDGVPPAGDGGHCRRTADRFAARRRAPAQQSRHRGGAGQRRHPHRRPAARPRRRRGVRGQAGGRRRDGAGPAPRHQGRDRRDPPRGGPARSRHHQPASRWSPSPTAT